VHLSDRQNKADEVRIIARDDERVGIKRFSQARFFALDSDALDAVFTEYMDQVWSKLRRDFSIPSVLFCERLDDFRNRW